MKRIGCLTIFCVIGNLIAQEKPTTPQDSIKRDLQIIEVDSISNLILENNENMQRELRDAMFMKQIPEQ